MSWAITTLGLTAFPVWKTCLLALLVSAISTSGQARPPSYSLKLEGKDKTIVRVFDQTTKKTIWRRTLPGIEGSNPQEISDFAWSKDHRAIAIQVLNTHGSGFHVIYWRAGERVRTIYYRSFTENDYIEKMVWSPDNRGVLVVYGGSGSWDMDTGCVACIDAERRRVYDLGSELGLKRVQWVGMHTVKFWDYDAVENPQKTTVHFVPKPKPIYWHIPGSV